MAVLTDNTPYRGSDGTHPEADQISSARPARTLVLRTRNMLGAACLPYRGAEGRGLMAVAPRLLSMKRILLMTVAVLAGMVAVNAALDHAKDWRLAGLDAFPATSQLGSSCT